MPYFTTDELRALPDLSDQIKYPPEQLDAAHDWIAGIVERECETSFIPTTITNERLTGGGTDSLRLVNAYIQSVTAVTVDGTPYTADQLAALVEEDGYLYLAGDFWPKTSRGNILVSYVSGWSVTPPADLKRAMLRAARNWVLTSSAWSGQDSRATSISNEWGNIQISVATEDHPTGLPDVDATIMAWVRKVRIPKVA